MRDNVLINIRERGKLVGTRVGHNVWIDRGRQYLAEMIGYRLLGPDTPERNERLRYMQVGIGGNKQSRYDLFGSLPAMPSPKLTYYAPSPLAYSYPPGYDPNATTGNQYNMSYPINPLISTLERPVRLLGTDTPYPGDPGDKDYWLVDTPKLFHTHTALSELTTHAIVSGSDGDTLYGFFTEMPLSEAGLVIDEAGTGMHVAYNPVVAYFTFDTILLTADLELELIWSVRF